MKSRKRRMVWALPLFFVCASGCATIDDVQSLDRDIRKLQSQMITLQKRSDTFMSEVGAFQKEAQKDLPALIQAETKKIRSDASESRADQQRQIDNLQSEVRILSTGIEEYKEFLKRPSKEIDRVKEDVAMRLKMLEERTKVREGKDRALEDRTKVLEDGFRGFEGRVDGRIKGLEEMLRALDGKLDRIAAKQVDLERVTAPAEKEPVESKVSSTGAGDFLYKDAYETFQRGNMEGARRKFEGYLKQYPNTELSDNAQFWIGETYYQQKDYEKAALAYERTIVKYPEGDKVSSALFKQGLAFLELGDKSNARNLLRRVIERYPNSEQADMAKKRLDAIK